MSEQRWDDEPTLPQQVVTGSTAGAEGTATSIQLCVLGGVRAERNGHPIELRGQVRQLLGIVLAEHDEPIATEVLIDRLWSGDSPRTARKIVHILASKLRHALAADAPADVGSPFLETTGDGYLLHGAPADLARYENLLAEAEAAAASRRAALASLEEALGLWGPPWGRQGEEQWLVSRVTSIEERHRRAEELFADVALDAGGVADLVGRLRSAVTREPFRERRWAQLMLAMYRNGRQVDALGVFDEASDLLRDEFGVAPGPDLQRLRVAILDHDVSLQPPRTSLSEVSGVTSFVGRDRELRRLVSDVARHRLVTVVGIGGIGKTRLVEEYAHVRRLEGDDVRQARLVPAINGRSTAVHIATELGLTTDVESEHDVIGLVAAALGREPVVLTLDAMDYASDAGDVVLSLVELCPRLRLVATSRVPLGVYGERTLSLEPLEIGTGDDLGEGTALDLLIDRAGLDTGSMTDETLRVLAARTKATGGIPMLVELAAPTVLDEDTATATAGADGSDRRKTTREAIAQALNAVDEQARELAIDATVLPDGLSDRTAAALRGLPRDAARRSLRQLAWVNVMHTRPGLDGVRYQSLDPIREALGPQSIEEHELAIDRATRAVEAAFLAFSPDPARPHVISLLDAAEDEHANLRFLLADQLQVRPRRALELAIAASEFWAARGFSIEGRRWIEEAIEVARPTGPLSWDATLALVRVTRTFPEIAALRGVIESCVEEMRAAREDSIRAFGGLVYLAIARGWSGDRQGAINVLDEAEPLLERWGTEWTRVQFDQLRGLQRASEGDLRGARQAQRAASTRLFELGDPSTAAMAVYLAAVLGDMAASDDVLDDIRAARELATTVKDVTLLGLLLLLEARVLRRAGDERGRQLFAEATQRLADLGGIRAASLAQRDLGLLALASGDDSTAEAYLRQALPPLLHLDRPSAGLAVGALAIITHRRGDEQHSATALAAALALREGQAPVWEDDWRQLAALASTVGMPLAEQTPKPLTDDVLLEMFEVASG